ncbi:hypothetical protein DFH08DRAFT_949939 [Mycena albidolilacea]|uniref:Uncharacterized protein n=1 Tax=Mycena albidolilacea TaxID=1033008 RepID=A0AAD7APB1_9AGAR|nr:hypothetical protein DFH08DRAFT_949939 [Mycena albidolilacea]
MDLRLATINTGGLTQPTQSAGGILIVDSSISGTGIGIRPTVLAVILDNVKFTGIPTANIQDSAGTVVAANAANVPQWFQGNRVLGIVKTLFARGIHALRLAAKCFDRRSSPDPGHSMKPTRTYECLPLLYLSFHLTARA